MLENQKLRDEIVEMQDQSKESKKQLEGRDEKIRHLEQVMKEADKNLAEVREESLGKDSEIDKYAKQAKRLADLNEELRALFEEERSAMTDEQERLEDEVEQVHH